MGKFYPLAVGMAGQYLLGDDLPKYGGIGTFGIRGVKGAVELPPLQPGTRPPGEFAASTVYNIDASAVIAKLEGASGAHNDLAHRELSWLGWHAALSRAMTTARSPDARAASGRAATPWRRARAA